MTPDELDALPFRELARHVDGLRDRVRHSDDEVRSLLEQTLDAVTAFHRRGLVTLVRRLREDPAAEQVLFAAVDEPEVMALLANHGVVRADQTVDVLRVVEGLRPYLVASNADVEVVRVDAGESGAVAVLRFSNASPELVEEVRDLVARRVPGLTDVVEADTEDAPGPTFLPLAALRVGAPPETS